MRQIDQFLGGEGAPEAQGKHEWLSYLKSRLENIVSLFERRHVYVRQTAEFMKRLSVS